MHLAQLTSHYLLSTSHYLLSTHYYSLLLMWQCKVQAGLRFAWMNPFELSKLELAAAFCNTTSPAVCIGFNNIGRVLGLDTALVSK